MVTKLQGNLLNSSAMNVYFISKILVFNLIPKRGGGVVVGVVVTYPVLEEETLDLSLFSILT